MANVLDVATKSPGVYVFEEPSAVKAIAGVSTSTAGFIGVILTSAGIPTEQSEDKKTIGPTTAEQKTFDLGDYPVVKQENVSVSVERTLESSEYSVDGSTVKLNEAPGTKAQVTINYKVSGEQKTSGPTTPTANQKSFPLDGTPDSGSVMVKVITTKTATIANNDTDKKGQITFSEPLAVGSTFTVTYQVQAASSASGSTPTAPEGVPALFTNFTEFKQKFGDFDGTPTAANYLRHAVFGFFNNGGSRCYVLWVSGTTKKIGDALSELAAIDEIAVVAAPGATSVSTDLSNHCQHGTLYRFAILDGPGPGRGDATSPATLKMPGKTNYAAFYYPWLKVADRTKDENGALVAPDGVLPVPPSGHIAGIYARVDAERGVHKAPANEPIRGALGVTHPLSKPQQDGLNAKGVNCIRVLNNNILVWGARTVGGEDNQDLKYINVRRTLLFLRKSIDQGTQWVVFEPNTRALWKKIVRNVTAFLTDVWRSGALFGDTSQEAFYVRCDDEINPPSQRELGLVVTEIGVAIARPAEFVVFRISQFTAPA